MNTPSMTLSVSRLAAASLLLTALLSACTDPKPTPPPPPPAEPTVSINFQPAGSATPAGFTADTGAAYSDARKFGWVRQDSLNQPSANHVPLDITANTRDRAAAGVDARLNTLIHMQYVAGSSTVGGVATPAAWEYAVANGTYTVTVAVGDPSNVDSSHAINVEGNVTVTAFAPTAKQRFTTVTRRVDVSDGRLTVEAKGSNTKLDYVIIAPGNRPSVATPTLQEGQTQVELDKSFSAELNLITSTSVKGNGLDPATLTSTTIKLTEDAAGTEVATSANTSGGGDAINVTPSGPLKPNTKYRLFISDGVKDVNGVALLPYTTTFTTGNAMTPPPGPLAFTQVDLTSVPTTYAYTSVEVGKDNKLYASTLTGEILRFPIQTDGTLGAPEILRGLIAQGQRTIIGLKFDPSSTASNPKLWVSNNEFYNVFDKAKAPTDYSGKITLLSGPNLDTVQDYVTGLPRSVKDHMTNSVNFSNKATEQNVLYIMQGSNSAMGAADATWGNRPERMLSGAMLRLDLSKMPAALPLNVTTAEGGGSYNPFAAGAPLTLFATGIRNAYDVAFHSNGRIYAPTNGSAAGGNTPGTPAGYTEGGAPLACANGSTYTGKVVPGLTNATVQNDYLFRVVENGYYGHPNPLRCEFVMNGGNPTAMTDPAEVVASNQNAGYPVGTQPDANYKGFAYNFGLHASANGVIEEYSAGGAATNNKLLVVRYSVGKDIIVLTPDGPNGDIGTVQTGVAGLSFTGNGTSLSPLDITENRSNGHLYVALLNESNGQGLIKLARPR